MSSTPVILYIPGFLLMALGLVMPLLERKDLSEGLLWLKQKKREERQPTLYRKAALACGHGRPGRTRLTFMTLHSTLKRYGQGGLWPFAATVSFGLAAAAFTVLFIMGQYLIAPAAALFFGLIPFWLLQMKVSRMEADTRNELETALNTVTVSYIRSQNLVGAVHENLPALHGIVKDAFSAFDAEVTCMNPDLASALRHLQERFPDAVFSEWCDALIECVKDRSFTDTLIPIVRKMAEEKRVNEEVHGVLHGARMEFLIMAGLVVGNAPLLYVLNREWFGVLVTTVPGHAVIALSIALIAVCETLVLTWTQPVRYAPKKADGREDKK